MFLGKFQMVLETRSRVSWPPTTDEIAQGKLMDEIGQSGKRRQGGGESPFISATCGQVEQCDKFEWGYNVKMSMFSVVLPVGAICTNSCNYKS